MTWPATPLETAACRYTSSGSWVSRACSNQRIGGQNICPLKCLHYTWCPLIFLLLVSQPAHTSSWLKHVSLSTIDLGQCMYTGFKNINNQSSARVWRVWKVHLPWPPKPQLQTFPHSQNNSTEQSVQDACSQLHNRRSAAREKRTSEKQQLHLTPSCIYEIAEETP